MERIEKFKVVVIDDDQRMRHLLGDILKDEGLTPNFYGDSGEALNRLKSDNVDIVISDLKMPHVDGIGVLERVKKINPDIVVILITGYGTIESAINAMKKGAYDYIQKPFEPDEFIIVIHRALEHVRLLYENKRLLKEVERYKYDELVGTSKAIDDLKELISKIAPFDTTVLIQGETGTGKELIARLTHKGSRRSNEKLLPVNCGAISELLLESELFGYEKGAFTGADRDKAGLFESVNGGTIFLDEINATSANLQVKLLRVLEGGSFLRVGSTEPVNVDVRIITASNVDLEKEVEAGRFRKDLFYRLNVVAIEIPPLRRRKDDIPLLSYHFLNKYSDKYCKEFKGIAKGVIEKFMEYSWPGNVRELENVIEKAVIMESSNELKSVYLPKKSILDNDDICSGLVSLKDMEKALIHKTLNSLQGQKAKAAEVLGISTTSLWRKIKEYQLE